MHSIVEVIRAEPGNTRRTQHDDWRLGFDSIAPGLQIESTADIFGQVLRFKFAGATLWSVQGSSQSIRRVRPFPARGCVPMAIIQLEGLIRIRQEGRECALPGGSFAFLDGVVPHSVDFERPSHHLVMQFPRTSFVPALLRRAVAVQADVQNPVNQLFFECVSAIWQAAENLHPLQHASALRALVSLGQLTTPIHSAAKVKDMSIRALKAVKFIEQHLGESWLTPQAVADSQGVSRRYLDELFASQEHRLQGWIRERRLQRAAIELAADDRSRSNPLKNILQIALDLGFKAPSHFSRSFATRFGMSPREFRQQSRLARLSIRAGTHAPVTALAGSRAQVAGPRISKKRGRRDSGG
jgi:AraC-like DNA-binding protein